MPSFGPIRRVLPDLLLISALATAVEAQDAGAGRLHATDTPRTARASSSSCPGSASLDSPDIAYDPTNEVFLKAWTGGAPPDCDRYTYASLYAKSGTLLKTVTVHHNPGEYVLLGSAINNWSARVVNLPSLAKFVVVWGHHGNYGNEDDKLGIAVVDAATGTVEGRDVDVATATAYDNAYRTVGRHALGAGPASGGSALVVYTNRVEITARRITVDAQGTLQLGTPFELHRSSVSNAIDRVEVAGDSGTSGRHLVVFDERQPTLDRDVRGVVVDAADRVVDAVAIATGPEEQNKPHVDGDGDAWCVAYRNQTAASVRCVQVTWNTALGMSWTRAPRTVAPSTKADWPVVEAFDDSYTINWPEGATLALASVDATQCLSCEGVFSLSYRSAGFPVNTTAVFARPREGIALISATASLSVLPIEDGFTTDLGGGCGPGGRAAAHCAKRGNANFQLGLADAAALTPAFVAFSAGPLPFPCTQSCTLIPDLSTGVVVAAGSTDALGSAALPAPLPNQLSLIGASFYEQWLLLTGDDCLASFALSNGLRAEIQ